MNSIRPWAKARTSAASLVLSGCVLWAPVPAQTQPQTTDADGSKGWLLMALLPAVGVALNLASQPVLSFAVKKLASGKPNGAELAQLASSPLQQIGMPSFSLKTGEAFAVLFATSVPGRVKLINTDAKGVVSDGEGRLRVQSRPAPVPGVKHPRKIASNGDMSFAIVEGGKVLTWWNQVAEIFVDEPAATARQPKLLSGLNQVVDLVSDQTGTTLALVADGSVRVWGSWSVNQAQYAMPPRPGSDFRVTDDGNVVAAGLPRVARLCLQGEYACVVGADNQVYLAAPLGPGSGIVWYVSHRYRGVPEPY
jgi:hypothetical protein